MRIERLRIDGYGLFAAYELGPFAGGLTIVYGPNEAGKSTLLDFVRGVLFGFPDRRSRLRYHEPLRGGRHGGAIVLVDEDGEPWQLERHLGAGAPALTASNGAGGDPARLARLLGGADEELFRSVFAFGLAELAQFDSLERDEVRDLVFSAGVIGAGRSATEAQRALRARELEIARTRRGEARANALESRLGEAQTRLRSASATAREFPAARAHLTELEGRLSDDRWLQQDRERRLGELDRLLHAAPLLARRAEASRALADLGAPSDCERATLARRGAIAELSAERSRDEANLETAISLRRSLDSIEQDLAAHLDHLAPRTLEEITQSEPEPGAAPRAAALYNDYLGQLATVRTLAQAVASTDEALRAAEAARDAAVTAGPARTEAELRKRADAAVELREVLTVRERLALDAARAVAGAPRRPSSSSRRPLGVVLLSLGAALIALGGAELSGHYRGLGMLGVALGVAGLVLGARRISRADHAVVLDDRGPEIDRLAARAGELAAEVGIHPEAHPVEVDAAIRRIEDERDVRRVFDRLEGEAATCRDRHEQALAAFEAAHVIVEDRDREARELADQCGLHGTAGAAELAELLPHLDEVRRLAVARATIGARLETALAARSDFLALATRTAAAVLGRVPDGELEARAAIGELDETLVHAERANEERARLEHELARTGAELATVLDAGALEEVPSASRLDEWTRERTHLFDQIQSARAELEAFAAEVRVARLALDRLVASDETVRAAQEVEGLESALSETLEEFLVVHLARTMLADTLARYERERQPAVIARAGALFCEITAGRYRALVAREEPDGQRHGISAIAASGASVDAGDLSTGTAEQLYLCLRLALAESFATSAVALPLVFDDVLVNFDPERAGAVARVLASVARGHQVLAFTCHPETVERFLAAAPSATVLELARPGA